MMILFFYVNILMEKDSLLIINFQLEKVLKNSKCVEDLGK